jgi:hypothetical protein
MNRRPAALLFSSAFGVLMVAAAARPTGAWGLAALGLAVAALVAALFVRTAAVVAVLLTIAGMALGDPVPVLAAVSGLAAAAYLITRYADDAATLTVPTVAGMVGFTVAGAAAGAVSLQLTWVPLVAPAIMATILILVAAPLVAEVFSAPAADRDQPR